MDDDPCDCHRSQHLQGADASDGCRWLGGPTPLEVPLPVELQQTLGTLVGGEGITTLAGWTTALGNWFDDGELSIDDLCHAQGSDHWGTIDGKRYHFRCVFDAVILAAIRDEAVEMQTTNPRGSTVTAVASGAHGIDVTPTTAVLSFGADPSVADRASQPTDPSVGYRAICPFVHVFATRAEYFAWATTILVPSVAMPMDAGVDFASALVG